jgi:hypothetical protein
MQIRPINPYYSTTDEEIFLLTLENRFPSKPKRKEILKGYLTSIPKRTRWERISKPIITALAKKLYSELNK